jgi:hypothetical protein
MVVLFFVPASRVRQELACQVNNFAMPLQPPTSRFMWD